MHHAPAVRPGGQGAPKSVCAGSLHMSPLKHLPSWTHHVQVQGEATKKETKPPGVGQSQDFRSAASPFRAGERSCRRHAPGPSLPRPHGPTRHLSVTRSDTGLGEGLLPRAGLAIKENRRNGCHLETRGVISPARENKLPSRPGGLTEEWQACGVLCPWGRPTSAPGRLPGRLSQSPCQATALAAGLLSGVPPLPTPLPHLSSGRAGGVPGGRAAHR